MLSGCWKYLRGNFDTQNLILGQEEKFQNRRLGPTNVFNIELSGRLYACSLSGI